MARNDSFFNRLTRLFRSGPAIQRRIRGQDANSYFDTKLIQGNYGYRAPAPFGFGRENSPFSVLGSYGMLDRMARYAEFAEMEYTPEIATALDIYADESVGGDEHGHSFHVYSDKVQIKRALEELFYDVLNVEFNIRAWARNLCKYGDFFLYNEVLPDMGVINAQPIPVSDIEREEGFDEEDPYAIRFKWLTRGNVYLENWQVTHFRILGNDLFLPYGTAVLEPARRIWRQLIMMEDAMLVYRVVRSPERRVFYIDVGNVAPNDVPSYMEAAKATLRSRSVIDKTSGRQDMRYNPLAIDEDYYIPVRGSQSGTKIETLAGGQHVTATEDVQYIQSKLFSALKVPKPYLNYDENLSCLTGDTKIPLLLGESKTIRELTKEYNSNPNKFNKWVYSTKLDGTVVPGRIKKVWKTKEVNQYYKITLDNGKTIECTENHPFLLREGVYKRADELEVGVSLMPIYRKNSSKEKGQKLEGYEMIFDNKDQKWLYTHRMVYNHTAIETHKESVNREKISVVHHKDFNKLNNNPDNLLYIGRKEHNKIHKNLATNNLVCKENRDKLRTLWKDPNSNLRKNHFIGIKNAWENENSLIRRAKIAEHNKKHNKISLMHKALNEIRVNNEPSYKAIVDFIKKHSGESLHFSDLIYHFKNSGPRIKKIISNGSNGKEDWNSLKKKYNIIRNKKKKLSIEEMEQYKTIASKNKSIEKFCREMKVSRNGFYNFLIENSYKPHLWFKENLNLSTQKEFYNHKIINVEIIRSEEPIPVYDLEIENPENTHNFLVEPGVVVHNSKATLAQTDVRFSRTISAIQKIIVSEMNKLAMIHLFAKGFDGEDLLNFELKLSNPSTVALQQKLELWATKMDIAGTAKEAKLVDERWIQKVLLELTDDEIDGINKGLYQDKIREVQLDQVAFEEENYQPTTTDNFNPSNYQMAGGNVPKGDSVDPPPRGGTDIITPSSTKKNPYTINYKQGTTPIKATPFLTRNKKNRKRRVGSGGRANTANPNFSAMLNPSSNKSLKDIYDKDFLSNPTRGESAGEKYDNLLSLHEEEIFTPEPLLSSEFQSMAKRFKKNFESYYNNSNMLHEEFEADLEDEIDSEQKIIEELVVEPGENIDKIESKTLKEAMDIESQNKNNEEEDENFIELDDSE